MPGFGPAISLRLATQCRINEMAGTTLAAAVAAARPAMTRNPLVCGGTLLQPLHDAQVAHGAVAERLQCRLVGRAVVRRDGLFHAGEFGDDDTLLQARLVGRRGGAAREIASAERRDRRRRELGVGRKLVGIGDRAIAGDPVAFGHGNSVEAGAWRAKRILALPIAHFTVSTTCCWLSRFRSYRRESGTLRPSRRRRRGRQAGLLASVFSDSSRSTAATSWKCARHCSTPKMELRWMRISRRGASIATVERGDILN